MKYIILIPDGAADYPVKELGDKTPLEVARIPHLNYLASRARCGMLETIPPGFSCGSAEANLSILGYDPRKYFHGRGVLEAASLGIKVESQDLVFRCNTLCILDGCIRSHSAGGISSEEAAELIETLNRNFGNEEIFFYPGFGYRHILLLRGDWSEEVTCVPPHDYVGRAVKDIMPEATSDRGQATARLLKQLIQKSWAVLASHPINEKRTRQGKEPANSIWPWSPGRKPEMESFQSRFGLKGAVIAAVDLVKGLGLYCGFDVIRVAGATGWYDTDYQAKAKACLDALAKYDLAYVHVEAPDEAGHEGKAELKIKCLEDFDSKLVAPVVSGVQGKQVSIAVLPDHPTPVAVRGHTPDAVPFLIFRPATEPDKVTAFNEKSCRCGSYGLLHGEEFIRTFLGRR